MKTRLNHLKFILPVFIVLFLSGNSLAVKKSEEAAKEIVKKVDELYRSNSSYALIEMEIVTTHWQRTLKVESWSMGKKHTFLRILEPKKERGMATLRIDKEMWNFFPKTNKVMKIPPSMMMGSWMGSDFTNDDLVKEYTYLNDYNFDIIKPKDAVEGIAYVKCIPKKGVPVVWGFVVIAVDKRTFIPKWQKFYDEKGVLMREWYFKEVKKMGNKVIPTVMELIPTTKKGKKTVIRYIKAKFDKKIDKRIFSLRNLRSGI